jgi:inhibitor of cysteine peptidase
MGVILFSLSYRKAIGVKSEDWQEAVLFLRSERKRRLNMKKSFLFALILGAWACAGGTQVEKVINVGPVHKPPAGSAAAESVVVRLTQDGGSQSVALAKGRTLLVAIAGNPSTGYQWELTGPVDGAVLTQKGRGEFMAGAPELVGAPGEYRFTFKAMGLGTTAVGLKYVRPWEKDKPPAATATVNVTVTE